MNDGESLVKEDSMGFRINNNISALIATGNLNKTQSNLTQSIERLSSGLRINRGADDAAGLTISEKLRGQIRGLNRAVGNAQDGISLIQTAEGALNENASILNRLRELAIQSQADSLTATDRLEIQKEVDQMVDEIDRISQTTEFNTKKLLDGSASALVSTDNKNLTVFQVGDAGQLSAGQYDISVGLEDSGARQLQKSAILADRDSGNKAGLATQLKDVASFYDNDGNNVIGEPKTITLRGNGQKADVTISADLTLQEITNAIETKITASSVDGGLGLTGSTFAFDSQSGQIIFESGRAGSTGELAIAAEDPILKAFGFQITTESESAAYQVKATTTGVATPTTTTANTTTNRASGVVEGLDFEFELASEARFDGGIAGTDSIFVGTDNIVFTIHDTNGLENQQAAGSTTAGVTITLTANRTYTTASVASIVNNSIALSTDDDHPFTGGATSTNFAIPGLTASMDGYNLKITSSATGTSGGISILANTAATNILGIQTSKVTGSGGQNALITGSTDISNGVTFAGTGVIEIQVGDGDFRTLQGATAAETETAGLVTFNAGTAISATSIVQTFNNQFKASNVAMTASVTSDGSLEIRSNETGTDARVSISAVAGSIAALGMISGQADGGEDGTAAVYNGATAASQQTVGFTVSQQTGFNITDKAGATSGTIYLGTAGLNDQDNESHTISKEQVTSLFNGSNISSTDVQFSFDAGNRLDITSRSAGDASRIVLSVSGAGGATSAAQTTAMSNAFGINNTASVQGSGTTEFNVHVADRSLKFQIGANKSQQLDFSVINTSAQSLGLKGLDVTNVKSATAALGAIDNAVNMISSERSKLGSLQNRMTSTINNLTVTATNLQSTESKIRDVDIAVETVAFTRNQILIQAGTAQLSQSRGIQQGALQLLG